MNRQNPHEPIVSAIHNTRGRLRSNGGLSVVLSMMVVLVAAATPAAADSVTSAQAQRIVSQYSGSFTSAASGGSSAVPSGPLMGNGNLGVVVVNPINTMTFLLGKNEFWSLDGKQVEPMASMALSIPGMSGASFAMKENIYTGTVTGQFTLNGNQIQTTSWVSSNDTTNNYLFTQFTYTGSGTQAVTVSLAAGNGNNYPTSSGSSGSVLYDNVAADSAATVDGYNSHEVRIAVGVVGTTGTISGSTLQFTLSPGATVTLVSSIMSNYDSASYTTQSISNVSGSTASSVSSQLSANQAWWSSFWAASYVEFDNNPVLQKEYYGSLYMLAASSEPNTAAPGLWGPWVETNPDWAGDYTTNYNYEIPPLAEFPTNHVALAASYDGPVEAWLTNAEANATSHSYTGAYWPVHIGPLPNGSYQTNSGDENLKSNGAFLATVMLEHYYVTQSAAYASTIWPTISATATFYQNYLHWNGTSYDDPNDATQENDPYPQTNGTMSLGLIRNLLQGAITLSTVLNESASQRSAWQNVLNNLTTYNGQTSTTGGLPYPTFTQNGQQVFADTQVGIQWASYGQEVWGITAAGAVGLGSSPQLITIAQNTVGALAGAGGSLSCMFFPAAARVGYSPSWILTNLTNWVNGNALPSLYMSVNGGGIENQSVVPYTISEMLMQSFQNNIIVFPNWPSNTNAHFGDHLAYGNFLVSSAIKNNSVLYVRIISQAGQTLSMTNPWPNQSAQFYRNGNNQGTLSGATFPPISTSTNDVLLLAPSGTSISTITSEMQESLSQIDGSGGSEGPYGGTAAAIPGTVLAENYDTGGQGTGYNVTSVNGNNNGYRFEGVDLETTMAPGGGNDIGWTNGGQWFRYTVNVATAGTYTVTFEVASPYGGITDGFHIANSTGSNLSGPVAVPNTGSFQNWTTVTATVALPAGQQVLTVYQDNGGWNIYSAAFALTSSEAPYGGAAAVIPGTVLAENYDTGGQGTGYNVTSVNGTNNGYRFDGVDLETTMAPGGGNDIGWTNGGQWFRYTVNVATAGTYTVTFEVASPYGGITDGLHIANSTGSNLSGPVAVPNTGSFQNWTTVTATVALPAGQQVLTVYQDNGGWNIYSAAFAH